MGQYKNNFYEINIKKHKYKNNHPIYQIQKNMIIIQNIFLKKFKFVNLYI